MLIHQLRKQERRDRFDKEHVVRDDGQIHLGAINLDAMSRGELEIASEHPALHYAVQRYALFKLEAGSFRLAGQVRKALCLESKCEQIYNQEIPLSCRW